MTFREMEDGFGVNDVRCKMKGILLSPKDVERFYPDELRGEENVYYVGTHVKDSAENQCGISEEEAFELAQRFVDRMDL